MTGPARSRRRRLDVVAVLVCLGVAAVGLRVLDANPAVAQTAALTAWQADADPGMDLTAGPWTAVPPVELSLSSQTVTYPTGGGLRGVFGAVPTLTARALHHDGRLYVAISWPDLAADTGTRRPEDFADAAALQLPSEAASSVPAVCMGQADRSVNIWHWRADSQEGLDTIPERGYVDGYPGTDDLWFPGRAAGNPLSDPDGGAVQDLVAGGFGTLTPGAAQTVTGHGTHDGRRWSVVFARDLEAPGPLQPSLAVGRPTDAAFAVWNGGLDQRDGLKSVTSFTTLELAAQPVPGGNLLLTVLGWSIVGVIIVVAARSILRPSRPRPTGEVRT